MGFSCCAGLKNEIFINNSKDFSYHFRKTHFGQKRNLYDFRCPVCNETLINVNYIKCHFVTQHRELVQFFDDESSQLNEPTTDQPQIGEIEDDSDSSMDFQLDNDSDAIDLPQDEQQIVLDATNEFECDNSDVIQVQGEQSDSDADLFECELNQPTTSSASACAQVNRLQTHRCRSNKQVCLDLMRDIKKNTSTSESALLYITRKISQVLLDKRNEGKLNLEFLVDFKKYTGSCYYLNKEQILSNNILIKEFELSNGLQQPFYRVSFRYIIEQLVSHSKLLDLIITQSDSKFY